MGKEGARLLVVYGVLGLIAIVWLLLLSLLLGWQGIVGMVLLLSGIAITVVKMNGAIATRRLPSRADLGTLGVFLMFAGAIGLAWGLASVL